MSKRSRDGIVKRSPKVDDVFEFQHTDSDEIVPKIKPVREFKQLGYRQYLRSQYIVTLKNEDPLRYVIHIQIGNLLKVRTAVRRFKSVILALNDLILHNNVRFNPRAWSHRTSPQSQTPLRSRGNPNSNLSKEWSHQGEEGCQISV
jgi:hypothetical protein